jgi:hypothetical protein
MVRIHLPPAESQQRTVRVPGSELLAAAPSCLHWLWRAVDLTGVVLDVLVQRRRDKQAAKRLLRKLRVLDELITHV